MNELQIFSYENKEVRTIQRDGSVWWVLKDVCDVLSLTNSRMVADRLDEDEKGVSIIDTLGGKQELTIINESGLYNIILLSRKPEAKKFKRWITHEVLPTIRKTGGYVANEDLFKKTRKKSVDIVFRQQFNMARTLSEHLGVKPGIAYALAITETEKRTGETLDAYKRLLPSAEHETGTLNATGVGKLIGIDARQANTLLQNLGLQYKDEKNRWRLTDAGKNYAEEFPFVKNGHSDYQIRWNDGVVKIIP